MKKTKLDTKEKGGAAEARAARPPGQFKVLALAVLMASPTNPRKTFPTGPLQELAASIKAQGVLQPLLVRALPRFEICGPDMLQGCTVKKDGVTVTLTGEAEGRTVTEPILFKDEKAARHYLVNVTQGRDGKEYEIVAGERRFRASGLAELTSVPCMIEVLDDKTVQEIQLIENLQREDLTAIDEAQGYKDLLERHGWTADDLAAKMGKSRSHVFAKLALLKTSPEVRKAIEDGKVSASVAELIGRIPGEKLQGKALALIERNTYPLQNGAEWGDYEDVEKDESDQMSYRKAKNLLEAEFCVWLKDAPFDVKEEYPGAPNPGPCAECPHRSGNCRDQFPDIKPDNVCTAPPCFQKKKELHVERQLEKFSDKGEQVMSAKESQKAFTSWGSLTRGYVEANADEVKAWTKKLGDKMPPQVVALDEDGKAHKLIRVGEVRKAAAIAEVQLKFEERGNLSETPEEKAKREREEKVRVKVIESAWPQVQALLKNSKKLLLAARWALDREHGNKCKDHSKDSLEDLARANVSRHCVNYWNDEANRNVVELAEELGIDVKKIKKEVEADFNTPKDLALGDGEGVKKKQPPKAILKIAARARKKK